MTRLNMAIKSALLAGAALAVSTASASDQELLDTLFQNGVLNQAQYEKLSKQAVEKAAESSAISAEKAKAMDWSSRIKIGGDMRFRQEFRDSEVKGSEKNRTRIRARIKVDAQVNDDVDVGFRLVTTGGTTSSNQTLEGGFGGKSIYFDRAFIKYDPSFSKGTSLILGKIKQPWFRVSNNVWDSDVNPEGVAITHTQKFGAVKLKATGGYFILANDDSGSFSDDMTMYHAGLSGAMKFNNAAKATLGFNTYLYNHTTFTDSKGNKTHLNCETGKTCPGTDSGFAGDNVNGDATAGFQLYEVAGKVDFKTPIAPIKLYGNYVVNAANGIKDGEDTAWLIGAATKYKNFKLSYDYRDTELNAVPDTFNDSDFNAGATAARGHVFKVGYKVSNNFSTGIAYLLADEYTDNNEGNNNNTRETLQFEIKAKF